LAELEFSGKEADALPESLGEVEAEAEINEEDSAGEDEDQNELAETSAAVRFFSTTNHPYAHKCRRLRADYQNKYRHYSAACNRYNI